MKKAFEDRGSTQSQVNRYLDSWIEVCSEILKSRPDIRVEEPFWSIDIEQTPDLTFQEIQAILILHQIQFIRVNLRDMKETCDKRSVFDVINHCLLLGDAIKWFALSEFEEPIAVAVKKKKGERQAAERRQGSTADER